MPRSTNVYLVLTEVGPIRAFTVKHELLIWLRRTRLIHSKLFVFRLPDGIVPDDRPPVQLNIPDLMKESK